MTKFFKITLVVLFLVTCVNCDGPPTIISSKKPHGKFSARQSTDSPPYQGTVFIDPAVLTDEDKNARKKLKYKGEKCRTIWHGHLDEWVDIKIYMFKLIFKDGVKMNVWVDPEYGSMEKAKEVAMKVTRSLGNIHEFLRRRIYVIVILSEGEGASADPDGGVITWHEQTYDEEDGFYVEESYLHEAAHTSIDNDMYSTTAWDSAVEADSNYISVYARDNPDGEDVAESFGAWYALKSGRLNKSDTQKIMNAIPNRLALFDDFYSNQDSYPVSGKKSGRKYKMPKKKDYGDWYHC